MLKRLGTFAVLAVCLFAMTIAIVGCGGGGGDEEDDDEGGTDVVSPMSDSAGGLGISKGDFVDLSGLYSYETPELGGVLSLFPAADDFEANLWFLTDDLEISDNSGTWTADRSNIDLLDRVYRYTWNGTHLTIRNLRTPDGRKDIRWLREEDWSD